MIGLVGVAGCLAVNAVSFVGILVALFLMRFRRLAPPERGEGGLRDELTAGFRYVGARSNLWVPVAISYGVAGLAMAFTRLLPVFATDVLHGSARAYGALMASPGVGAVAASLWIASRGRRKGRTILYAAVATLVTSLCVFALSRHMWLSLLMLAIVGGAQMVFRTSALATIHHYTDDRYRGRVLSIFLLDYGLWSFGTLWLGFLADARGPSFATLVGAIACLGCTAMVATVSRLPRFARA
jgi:predicted MFS family arabinose efflux permease